MPVFNIHHITKYQYDRPIKESVNEIRIYPFNCNVQETLFHQLNITDNPDILEVTDYWGNQVGMFNLMAAHQELVIESKLIIRTLGNPNPPVNSTATLAQLRDEVSFDLNLLELIQLQETGLRQQLQQITDLFYSPDMSVAMIVEKCSAHIFNNFKYIKGITHIETTVAEILQLQSGVCQDFAHVMLELLRHLQIPGRYVSGYICPNNDGMRGEGATHAWVEAWIPGYGWTGIDPTNNVWVTNNHVKLAVGRGFNDCSPIKGTFKGPARQSLSVYVSVGYEDGHTFEELTDVTMQPLGVSGEHIPEYIENFAGQQQQ